MSWLLRPRQAVGGLAQGADDNLVIGSWRGHAGALPCGQRL